MRQKVAKERKREVMIGVKVTANLKEKIEYLAASQGEPTSTYIYNLLNEHIQRKNINWEKELQPQKEDNSK